MNKLQMCRICLAEDVRMHFIVDTHLQGVYETLSLIPLKTEDIRPIQVCFICYASLNNFYKLRKRCIRSEELFAQVISNNMMTPLEHQGKRLKLVHLVVEVSIGNDPECSNQLTTDSELVEVKLEHLEENEHIALQENALDGNKQHTGSVKLARTIIKEEKKDTDMKDQETISKTLEFQVIIKEEMVEIDISGPLPEEATQATCSYNSEEVTSRDVKQAEPIDKTPRQNSTNKINNIDKTTAKSDNPKAGRLKKYNNSKSNSNSISKNTKSKRQFNKSSDNNTSDQHICDICQKPLRHRSDLLKHIRVHSDNRPYQCNVCGKGFNYRNVLRDHIRTHTGEKPYQCDVCLKHFSRLNHMKVHKLIHSNVKSYECNICEKTFNGKVFLNQHVRRMHVPYTGDGEKPYECEVCNKRFKDKAYLNSHILAHAGKKPYQCEVCHKSFIKKQVLYKHMLVHTGEKPYACTECEKSFTSKCDLMRHFRVHTGEKPFQCEECFKCFSLKKNLGTHMRIHERMTY